MGPYPFCYRLLLLLPPLTPLSSLAATGGPLNIAVDLFPAGLTERLWRGFQKNSLTFSEVHGNIEL